MPGSTAGPTPGDVPGGRTGAPPPDSRPRPLTLIVLDGWGLAPAGPGNAISLADTPNLDRLAAEYPNASLGASGEAVGLPEGQQGNSEVGHLNLGAGRIVWQDLTRISKAIADDSFFENPVLIQAVERAREGGHALHLMGLVSDGGVHSHNTHIYALLELAKRHGLADVWVHAFLDGRDVPPRSALGYLAELEAEMARIGVGRIATVSGRYYAMDRDRRWERVQLAYEAIVRTAGGAERAAGEGTATAVQVARATTAAQAVEQSYAKDAADEFVLPTVIDGYTGPCDQDSVIFFNFRPDRTRELTRALTADDFDGFDRGPGRPSLHFVCMTEYDETFKLPIAFPPERLSGILTDVLSGNGLAQLRIAETEKYAHVTFFFNGGEEEPRPGEERRLIPSPKVATYDLKPEMSAYEVTDAVLQEVARDKYDVIILNYANADMVGHTGVLEAAIKAVEAVDTCVGRVTEAVLSAGGECIVTGDHGNAEWMLDDQGHAVTAHTCDRVPVIYVGRRAASLRKDGRLADIAPTMLRLLDLPQPAEMTGRSLLTG